MCYGLVIVNNNQHFNGWKLLFSNFWFVSCFLLVCQAHLKHLMLFWTYKHTPNARKTPISNTFVAIHNFQGIFFSFAVNVPMYHLLFGFFSSFELSFQQVFTHTTRNTTLEQTQSECKLLSVVLKWKHVQRIFSIQNSVNACYLENRMPNQSFVSICLSGGFPRLWFTNQT